MAKSSSPAADAAAETGPDAPAGLPVDTLREAVPYLRRPFTPEAVKFKVQTVFKGASGCLVVAYIDARLVIERLNLVVPDMWQAEYEPIDGTKTMWCHLSILMARDERFAARRSDIGEGQGRTDGQQAKAMVSDSLKRAAVHFGVGVSVYALPQITLYAGSPHVETRTTAKGPTLVLTEAGHTKLRDGYRTWLETKPHGFGEPLNHGDVEGATMDEDEGVEDFAPELAPALDDAEAISLRVEIREEYDAICKADPQAIPPVKYRAWLDGAAHSHEELERLLAHLRERRAEVVGNQSEGSK